MKQIIIFFLIFSFQGFAQNKTWWLPEKPVTNSMKDLGGMFKEPFENKKKSLIVMGGLGIATVGLYQFDNPIQRWSQDNRSEFFHQLSANFLEPMGGGEYSLALLGGMGLSGVLFKNEKMVETCYLGVEAFIISGLLARVPKTIWGRKRPYVNNSPERENFQGPTLGAKDFKEWMGVWSGGKYASYISGHTTSAFAVATVIAEQANKYGKSKWIPITCYTLASLSGYSRIYDNKHWATDVLGGAFFGYVVGKYVVNHHHWKISPYAAGETKGFSMTIKI